MSVYHIVALHQRQRLVSDRQEVPEFIILLLTLALCCVGPSDRQSWIIPVF
jgi:hypothetical protein